MNPLDTIINVAFIIVIVAFFKQQIGLTGWKVILAAFLVALVLVILTTISTQFPVVSPWLDPIVLLIKVFLGATGTVDFINELRKPKIPPSG